MSRLLWLIAWLLIIVGLCPYPSNARVINLMVERTDTGLVLVELRVGTPPRTVQMVVDFQSDVSGIWTDDLAATSASFCDECQPVSRDFIYFGPFYWMMELRSIVSELRIAQRTGIAPAWSPAYPTLPPNMLSGEAPAVNGWLAMSPRSEFRQLWPELTLTRDILTLESHEPPASAGGILGNSYLPRSHRLYPNVHFTLHPQHLWWHDGYLVRPLYQTEHMSQQLRKQFSKERAKLVEFGMENATFVLFGNDSRTLLSQAYYNALFFGTNLYHDSTLPSTIQLAPGLELPKSEWFHEEPLTHMRWVDIDFLPQEDVQSRFVFHPIEGVQNEDMNVLGLSLLGRFALRMSFTDLALVVRAGNDHIDTWKLFLLIALFLMFLFIFLVRSVYLRPLTFAPGSAERRFNRDNHWLTIGFHAGGYSWLLIAQLLSIALQLTAYWTSDKMPSMRTAESQQVVVFWMFTIYLNVGVLIQFTNIICSWLSVAFGLTPSQREVYLARVLVISQPLHCIGLIAAAWILLMDRTSRDITNLAASIFALIMLFVSGIAFFVLMDRVFHRARNAEAQLWPVDEKHSRFKWLNETLTYYFALAVLIWLGVWLVWMVVFTSWFQIYDQLLISMSSVTRPSLMFLALTLVCFVLEYSVITARTMSKVNHMKEFIEEEMTPG